MQSEASRPRINQWLTTVELLINAGCFAMLCMTVRVLIHNHNLVITCFTMRSFHSRNVPARICSRACRTSQR